MFTAAATGSSCHCLRTILSAIESQQQTVCRHAVPTKLVSLIYAQAHVIFALYTQEDMGCTGGAEVSAMEEDN